MTATSESPVEASVKRSRRMNGYRSGISDPFFRTYFFCCASASRTLSANDFSAFATIALNASVSMHVTQSGLTGSAGFNGRPRFCR
jgi:hypothetical protein